MRATLLLADAAQVVEGKLYLLGGGWTWTGPAPSNLAVAILVHVPWDRANASHRWELTLVDTDHQPVEMPTAEGGSAPMTFSGQFEVGRPPGSIQGMELMVPLAINMNNVPFPRGQRLVFLLSVDGEHSPDGQLPFQTRT